MAEISETPLPGVGVRHEFTTRAGARIGVITHRTGHRDLLVYDRDDPDRCDEVLRLEDEDSQTLAELLGAARVSGRLAQLQQSVEGLVIDWLLIDSSWACVGHTIRDYEVRRRTGVSIVAVLRGERSVAAPAPDFTLQAGDAAVVVGTADGVKEAFSLLKGA